MASPAGTRILGKRLRVRRLTGWVRRVAGDGEGAFALDTAARRVSVSLSGVGFRDGQRLSLVAAYRGRGHRRGWALWIVPASGHYGWVAPPWRLAMRLGVPWRPLNWWDPLAAGALVWAVAMRALHFPGLYRTAEALLGEGAVTAVMSPVFGLFHRLDRTLVEWEWMKAYDRVFDFPVWLGAGVALAYALVRLVAAGLSLAYATFRLRRSVMRAAQANP